MKASVPSPARARRPRRAPRRGARSPAATRLSPGSARPRERALSPRRVHSPHPRRRSRTGILWAEVRGPGPRRQEEHFRQKPLGAGGRGWRPRRRGGAGRPSPRWGSGTLGGKPLQSSAAHPVVLWVSVSPALRRGFPLEPRCLLQSPAHRGRPGNSPLLASSEQNCLPCSNRVLGNRGKDDRGVSCSSQLGRAKAGRYILGLSSMGDNK